jgi:heme/copper-type cytochrome/quinol oxidase subunit 2
MNASWLLPSGRLSGAVQRLVATVVAVLLAGGTTVFACPMCFGAEDSPLIDGAKLGVLVMVAITLAVQGAFVAFFLYLRRRAKRIADLDLETEWAELQRPSRTS